MKSKASVVLLLLAIFLNTGFTSIAKANTIKVFEENQNELRIIYYPKILGFDTVKFNNQTYIVPISNEPIELYQSLDGTILVATSKLIAVPDSNSFQIQMAYAYDINQLTGHIPTPREYETYYSANFDRGEKPKVNVKNDSWAFIKYLGIGRNIHLAKLYIIIAKSSLNSNNVKIAKRIEVTISFPTVTRRASSDVIQDILNPKQAKNWILDFGSTFKEEKKADGILATNNTCIKIKVEKEGIYKIDNSMLSALGINITPELVSTIKLFGRDGNPLPEPPADPKDSQLSQIPIIVKTKQNGELNYILFYGRGTQGFEYSNGSFTHYQNQYSNYNYYLLSWSGEKGLRIQLTEDSSDCQDFKIPEFYTERIFFKEEITNPFNSGSGNIWFGGSLFPRYFTNTLPDLFRKGEILYRFYVAQNYSDEVPNLYGQFTFYEGQNKLGEVYIPRCNTYEEAKGKTFETKVPSNLIGSDNRSYLRIEYKPPTGAKGSATPFFNWYEIHYPRLFKAVNNTISFFSEPNYSGCYEFQITGFENEIIGLDVTIPTSPKLLTNNSIVASNFIFRTHLDSGKVKKFFISSNFLKPEVEKIELAGLRNEPLNSEVIVITHKLLLNSANKYKEYRENTTKYKVSVVQIDDIYNEYSYGVPDPMAIRYFLYDALKNWKVKPKFVVLWGDGHYDFRYISTKKVNYLPAFQADDNLESYYSTVSYTSDDFYGLIVGNDWVMDVVIARVPVYDDQTGLAYIEKLINYENNQEKGKWRTTALFCADDSPQSKNSYDGSLHTRDSESITNNFVPKDINIEKIYLPEYPTENIPGGRRKPLATADLVRKINYGTFLVNWLGHGNPRVWAHEELFNRDQTISLLTNKNKLFVGIAATCDFGRFDMTETNSGTEELLFYRKGGAIAYFSATRAVYTTDNKIFNQNIIQELFKRKIDGKYQTIGEAYFNVKQISIGDNHRKYQLFGDPLITLIIPENIVKVTKINNIDFATLPKDSVLVIKAYSKLKLEGEIISPNDSTTLSDFNGTVEVVINDVGYTKTVIDIDNTKHYIYKEGGIISKGLLNVINGRFNGEFYISDEVSYLDGRITIRFFAKDTTLNLFAKGFENRLKIVGIDTANNFFDTEPPSITIFIDDTTFTSGDTVSNPPTLIVKLYDNTAINTTGVGIGHLIEAWIDDNPESFDLTNYYEPSPTNPKEGFIKTLLPQLTPGKHKITVRAWDIFNNYALSSTEFVILDPDAGIILNNLSVKPQPASNYISFYVRHNINEPYEATLQVFDIIGNKIFENKYEENKLSSFELVYNCTDQAGNQIPTGVYLFTLDVATSAKKARIIGKFAIVK